jgi:hypothetical protein
MGTALTTQQDNAMASIEEVLMTGDLKSLSAEERVIYHNRVCESIGLNPLTRPFDYLNLNNKLILYARKDATDQLRALRGINIIEVRREQVGDLLIVTATAQTKDGRRDESIGAVNTKGLAGEALANALMKAETKAKRRVTLSIAGLGLLDESEAADGGWDDSPPAREPFKRPQALSERASEAPANLDTETGELDPTWNLKDLADALKAAGIKMPDLAKVLDVPAVTKENAVDAVDRYMSEHPGTSLMQLVELAVESQFEPAPEAAIDAEQQPEMALS